MFFNFELQREFIFSNSVGQQSVSQKLQLKHMSCDNNFKGLDETKQNDRKKTCFQPLY